MPDLSFSPMATIQPKTYTLRFGSRLYRLDRPNVMGILNITPDSFFRGSRAADESAVLRMAEEMLVQGADFLDVGGYSTRPGAAFVSGAEEQERVVMAVATICRNFPEAIISVDSFRSEVAKAAVEAGAHWVNDVSGGLANPEMLTTVAELKVPYIQMHIRKNVQEMHVTQTYSQIELEVARELAGSIEKARLAGITDVVADPGFGFSKSADQNFQLLSKLEFLHMVDCPLLVGLSRKSMVYKMLQVSPEEALNGTSALHTIALLKGAHILRVHDVKAATEVIKMVELTTAHA